MFDFFFAASGTTLYIIFYICCKPIYSNNFVKVRFPSVPCICLMVIIQFYTVLHSFTRLPHGNQGKNQIWRFNGGGGIFIQFFTVYLLIKLYILFAHYSIMEVELHNKKRLKHNYFMRKRFFCCLILVFYLVFIYIRIGIWVLWLP